METSSLLLVGEDNPYGADPKYALYHKPRHASGNRLRQHLGLRDATYERLRKINLCGGKWSMREARVQALLAINEHPDCDVFVLLGSKVREAFGLKTEFFGVTSAPSANLICVVLPHPSGLNRLWNEPGARESARVILKRLAPGIPWGETERETSVERR